MATLALSAAGAAAGSALLPGGFGTAISGATLGGQIGAFAGRTIDQALLGAGHRGDIEGPRLEDLRVTGSTEGAPIPRVYGAARVGSQLIWASDFEEVASTETVGGGKGGPTQGQRQTTFSYYASFAVAVCDGKISGIDRIWADGQELDQVDVDIRVYAGSETQEPDPLISASVDDGEAPAFRGTAYVVFERLPVAAYGNRIPQLSFEVIRAPSKLGEAARAMVLIPGTGEFSCATTEVVRTGSDGQQVSENRHSSVAATDIEASLTQMSTAVPAIEQVSFVVSWFGTDLRAGHCEIKPGVDGLTKPTDPLTWSVSGVDREDAHQISITNNRANYGGTPSDEAVIQGIRELKSRGYDVMVTPFILMDIPEGNLLPNPYTGMTGQPAHPWRGRITVEPAPGVADTVDQTSVAAAQIASIVGTAAITDFTIDGDTVRYTGPPEWSLRRQVLHYAHLAVAAGGVGSFLLGSELRALTQSRSSQFSFPFVDALVQLAGDVRQVLGPETKISYAADWSEYFGFQPSDGSDDVYFHLDPLWALDDIDAVSIDLYWPLSDWRSEPDHIDADLADDATQRDYLRSNVAGGEGYEWFYRSAADRDAQVRTPITDGAGKPWVFRYKDLASWWSNAHYNCTDGIEVAEQTGWVPKSKPIWLTEVGCPALDNGANQPNVFYDPKSSENSLPYYSRGVADELMQRRYIEALISSFDEEDPEFDSRINPYSDLYGDLMVPRSRIYLYAWDLRPSPAFPHDRQTWSDGTNWRFGHWLNARAYALELGELLKLMSDDYDFPFADVSEVDGMVPGLVVDRIMSFREASQGLQLAYFLDFIERGDRVVIQNRAKARTSGTVSTNELVERNANSPRLERKRSQETELPKVAKVGYLSRDGEYASEVAEAQRQTVLSRRVSEAQLGLMLSADQASTIAHNWLYEAWTARDQCALALPPSKLGIEAGDVVSIANSGRIDNYRIQKIQHGSGREVEGVRFNREDYTPVPFQDRIAGISRQSVVGRPQAIYLDLPIIRERSSENDGYLAVYQKPWPGSIGIYRSSGSTGFDRVASAAVGAVVGTTLSDLQPGPCWVVDFANAIEVEMQSGVPQSVSVDALLDGANGVALLRDNGDVEILQFESAELIGSGRYRLRNLLRGQLGTEYSSSAVHPAGSRLVWLNRGLTQLDLEPDDLNRTFNWRYGPDAKAFLGPAFGAAEHAFRGAGLRPLAPVHIRGERTADRLEVSWTRRARVDGDSWEQYEVPLNEERELYLIEVLQGSTPVRSIEVSLPHWVYPANEIVEDFGMLPDTVHVRVAQLSTRFGAGVPTEALV